MPSRGRRKKTFLDYVAINERPSRSLVAYAARPADSFLEAIVHISDSAAHCIRHFPKKNAGIWTSSSKDSFDEINAALLCTIMGHFELFQRYLFSSLLELTRCFINFDADDCVRNLKKHSGLDVEPVHMMATEANQLPLVS